MRAKIKIGDLIEALGCNNPMQEINAPETLRVKTPEGFKKVIGLRKTELNPEWKVQTNNFSTIVADKHKIEMKNGSIYDKGRQWELVENVKPGNEIYTENGYEKVNNCESLNKESYMYDLQVEETNSFFADGIHSHNSIFLPNLGFHALVNRHNVVHYSLEMSEDRVGQRYDSIASGIVHNKLEENIDEIKKKYDTIKKLTDTHLKIKEFPTSMASVLDIEAHLEELKMYHDFVPDIIIIDYGDIMRSTRKGTKNAYEEQGWIFRELRGLAVKRNIVVMTATQSTRDSLSSDGGTKDIIGMDQTADSMEKNRILDVLFSITQSRQDKDDGKIGLWVAKNRNGKSSVNLDFNINYNKFKITEVTLGGNFGSKDGKETDED